MFLSFLQPPTLVVLSCLMLTLIAAPPPPSLLLPLKPNRALVALYVQDTSLLTRTVIYTHIWLTAYTSWFYKHHIAYYVSLTN